MKNHINSLGKKVSYPEKYNPGLLDRILRSENREQYNIDNVDKLFLGFDIWHAWEFGFLLNNGFPVTGVLKIVIPSSNKYIVESKSLKLYLNSFNMSSYGNTIEEGLSIVIDTINNDLRNLLECGINVSYFNNIDEPLSDFEDYFKIEDNINIHEIDFVDYRENPDLLNDYSESDNEIKIYSDVLRSNCKVTHQPDWGTVFIHIKGSKEINKESLLKYLVSFRNENHFHEEVCEMIYKRLYDKLSPEILVVTCVYTRRGGIDISPTRANISEFLPQQLINHNQIYQKLYRQ